MGKIKKMCVIGNEKRQTYIAEMLCERGIEAVFKNSDITKEKLSSFEYFLLPVPVTRDGYRLSTANDIFLMELLEVFPDGCTVIGGKIPQFFYDHLLTKNISICDFYDDREYLWKNAEITAEGALLLLMGEDEFSLDGRKILVSGYGRIGKCLSRMLTSLRADVTVLARRTEVVFEAAVCGGFKSELVEKADTSRRYDAVFNTVPNRMFEGKLLNVVENSIYIELASAPYGGDGEVLEEYCKKYILASGVPGKYAPRSDAEGAYKAIVRHIFEEESI